MKITKLKKMIKIVKKKKKIILNKKMKNHKILSTLKLKLIITINYKKEKITIL